MITKELVGYCHRLAYEDLPQEVVDKVKYFALDYIGVAARGSRVESSEAMFRALATLDSGEQGSVVIGTAKRASAPLAALANGTSSHSLELDDTSNEGSIHPGVAIFPTAIAMGEWTGCAPQRFITAVTVGYEVAIRLSKALKPDKHYEHGFHPTGTCGTLGAAITAAKVLGLDEERMTYALGIAGSQAAGLLQFLEDGSWTKRMHPGWAAHSGIMAALLAREGYKGPRKVLEGKWGFLHAYSDHTDYDLVCAELGEVYHILRTSIKPHACCRYNQPGIDGILEIVKAQDLRPEEIQEVEVGILEAGWNVVAVPAEQKQSPQSVVDAQFSMPYAAAVAIAKRRAFLDEYDLDLIRSQEIRSLAQKVRCFRDPELDRHYPRLWPSRVVVRTTDGRSFQAAVEAPKGDPDNPLSWEEIIEKFDSLTAPVYDAPRREAIVRGVRGLDGAADLMGLFGLLLSVN